MNAKHYTLMAALLLSATATIHAGITFTIEAPGVQTSQVAGVVTEDFNDGNLSSALGTYSGGFANGANPVGGAGGTGYFLQNGPTILNLNSPQYYFGLWWSAGDAANQLDFYDGASLVASYNVGSIIPYLTSAYYGNPTANFLGHNTAEPYAYLNFTATGTTQITRIEFNGGNFESDNHSVYNQRINPPGTDPTSVPDSGSTLALGALALMSLAAFKRAIGQARA